MKPSFKRVHWPSGLLSSKPTSERCRTGPQMLGLPSRSRLISTSQTSTNSHKVSADVSSTTKQGSRPSKRPVALPPLRDPPTAGTVAPVKSIPNRRVPKRHYTITTLDPARLDPSCFLDLSGRNNFNVYGAAFLGYPSLLRAQYIFRRSVHTHMMHFPQDTRGFLYFHPNEQNPLQSQIRFRVTEDCNPARGFPSGRDLMYGNGYVWHVPLAYATKKSALREMLLRDALVDDALLAQLQAHYPSDAVSRRVRRAMSALDQPFTLEFKRKMLCLIVRVVGEDRQYMTDVPLKCYAGSDKYMVYEEGSALCRFERSTLPQHAGRRIMVLRLLKFLQPPKRRSGLPPAALNVSVPAEGELFKFGERAWYRDVDKPGKGPEILRLLYEQVSCNKS